MAEDQGLSLLEKLPPSSLPAEKPGDREPDEVATAYKSGLKTVHSMQGGEVCELLAVDPRQGLPNSTADARLQRYARNELSDVELSVVQVKEWARQRYSRPCHVMRDGIFADVNPARLVVGDIVYVGQGQDVPADMRILNVATEPASYYTLDTTGDWQAKTMARSTFVDATLPCDMPPFKAGSEPTKNQAFDKANNVAFRGSHVLSGGLVGLVFATGSQCLISKLKKSTFKPYTTPKLPRGLDKKKTAKIAQKIDALGLHPKSYECFGPLCGCRCMTVIYSVTPSVYKQLGTSLPKIIAQRFRVILLFSGEVTSDQVRQLPNTAIGKPIDLSTIHNFDDASTMRENIHRASSESAVLAYCSDQSMKDVIIAAEEKFAEPVVLYSHSATDTLALERATLSICSYLAPAQVLQASDAYLGPGGLSRLALYLKVLKESTEASNN
eukprot:TRINITY_DN11493_c0_g1_i4.p2 TRINITY_DN11493_c0_g1~~TRINITY_DN11493_c0_g1_i4.p2  ORF type:complete len:441 (+),score=89.91 TRINITY_DN11493_c0_g1_i4:81-1403(+)